MDKQDVLLARRALLRRLMKFIQDGVFFEYAELIDELLDSSDEDDGHLLDCAIEHYGPVCAYLESVRRGLQKPDDDPRIQKKPYDFG